MGYIMELRKIVGTRPLIMTGACTIVIDEHDRILLQLRTDNGLWGLPGGSLEPGESMEEVAKRELYAFEVFNVIVAYICREYQGDICLDEEEVKEIKFFPIQDIPNEISPPDLPVLNKFLKTLTGGSQ
ncbi:NUDIX domain-containing protein [Cohnella lupini]|uniref:ADP-ribose pyrophosphatase YjhB (NUDIX family) n=1 Tax=Cohnella lupini TaxID=1294267 RepID=A0A3D9IWE8_9BACL|nr:NUDIX domain-containing protein [Cohnella lupini]RED66163.1 ADP-ribose pyrophosphatase YjhB (NUDIX family) [Cohnella lupini]